MTLDEALQLVADGGFPKDWKHFSGDHRFPVPSDIEGFSSQADKRYQTCDSFYSGEYGEMRRKLAGYLAGRLPK